MAGEQFITESEAGELRELAGFDAVFARATGESTSNDCRISTTPGRGRRRYAKPRRRRRNHSADTQPTKARKSPA